jgi:Icc-related predicted phosphoesterase
MIRIAAAGDVHYGKSSAGRLVPYMEGLAEHADIFLLAGDLTHFGTRDEIHALANDLSHATVPVITVFGNHDYHSDQADELKTILENAGVVVLEQSSYVIDIKGSRVGVVGLKGFGGGFAGACGTEFGEPEMKAFIGHTKRGAHRLRDELKSLQADYKIALLHYSPIPDTLAGEKKEIYPFLGSFLLAEAVDEGGADIVFHGHAHHGVEKGATPGGVPVRNVAQPVIRHAYNIYTLNKEGLLHSAPPSNVKAHAQMSVPT